MTTPPTDDPAPAPDPPGLRRYVRSDGQAAVTFEATVCQHAAECVKGLPEVFDTAARPWIQPDHASVDAVEAVIARCPSRALKFERPPAG